MKRCSLMQGGVLVLVVALILAAGLPAGAAYTKYYRMTNTTGDDYWGVRAITLGAENITQTYSSRDDWNPADVGYQLVSGVLCSKLVWLKEIVPDTKVRRVAFSTADNSCRVTDLRWLNDDGSPGPVIQPDINHGIPGSGEVRWNPETGTYTWLIINDTDSPINIANMTFQILEGDWTLEDLDGMMWPATAAEQWPPYSTVETNVNGVKANHIQPLIDGVNDAEQDRYLSPDDAAELRRWLDGTDPDHLNSAGAIAQLETGLSDYQTAPQDAEDNWKAAVGALEQFKSLVQDIQDKMPVIGTPPDEWSSWWGGTAPGDINEDAVLASYSRIGSGPNHAYTWDSRQGDSGFVELHNIRPPGMAPTGQSVTYNIDNHGRVAGIIHPTSGPPRGVIWVPDASAPEGYVAVDIPPPPLPNYATRTSCLSINDNGLAVCHCWYYPNYCDNSYLVQLNPDNTVDFVRVFDYGTGVYFYDINNAGQICGYYRTGSVVRPFLLTPSLTGDYELTLLSVPPETTGSCYALRVSEQGHTAGYAQCSDGLHAVAWRNDATHTLVDTWDTPIRGAAAYSVNSDGDVVGGRSVWNIAGSDVTARSIFPSAWNYMWSWGTTDGGLVSGKGPETHLLFVADLDVLPYVLPDSIAEQWKTDADEAKRAITKDGDDDTIFLPGEKVLVVQQLGSDGSDEDLGNGSGGSTDGTDLTTVLEDQGGDLNPNQHTGFSTTIGDNQTGMLTNGVPLDGAGTSAMRTMQTGEIVLECVELYTPEPGGPPTTDTTPPSIDHATISPDTLTPDGQMVEMTLDVQISDTDDAGAVQVDDQGNPLASWYVQSVSCDQPEASAGDDWVTDDAQPQYVQLRGDRDPYDPAGRTYTVTLRAVDDSANLSAPTHLEVFVPATSTLTVDLEKTWHRFSVPLEPHEPSPADLLAELGEPRIDWLLFNYTGGHYVLYPDAGVRDFTLGRGYWLYAKNDCTVEAKGLLVDPSRPFDIDLPVWWSIIGCPFNEEVPWDDDHVQVTNGESTVPLMQAVSNGWLYPTIYGLDANHNVPIDPMRAPGSLEPWQGYLVCARTACTLSLTGAVEPAGAVVAREPSADDWAIRLVAEAGEFADMCTCVGVDADAAAATEPHPPAGAVDLFVKTSQALEGGSPGNAVDLRKPSDDVMTWDVMVQTTQADADVTVRWPDLSELPHDLVAYLVDPATDRRIYMRTQSGYQFRSSEAGSQRQLRVEVRERGEMAAMVSSLSAAQAGTGAEVVFTLSSHAAVEAMVLNIAGRTVKRLATDRTMAAGINSLHWDGRGDTGTQVPSGRYLIRVTARAEDGMTSSALAGLHLAR
ncbi:MAG: FlgD immunoglobulin-like domain containing protein [Armatimonadota bacterium]